MLWPLTIAAIMFVMKNRYWAFGLTAMMISQVLIIIFWHDAKYGTIPNVVLLIASIIGYNTWSYYNKYLNDVKKVCNRKNILRTPN